MSSLTAALSRFDDAVETLETTLSDVLTADGAGAATALSNEVAALKSDRSRLETELGAMRAETAMLEAFTDQLSEKIDTAISEIRDILEH